MQGDKVLEGHHAIAAAQFLNSTVRVCKLRPKYKKIKLLGRGWWGETHLVEEDGVKYALKTERILSKESIQGELDFYSFIDSLAENDQKYFTKLHSYAIYKGQLSFTPPENIKKRKDALTRHKLLKRAGLYCEWLMEYAGDSVLNVKNKITVVRQTLKAAYILRKNGYSHGDIHTANMCFTKNLKLIDYGGIGATTERRKKMFETNHDLTRIINYSLNSRGFFDSIGNVRYKVKDYIDHFKKNDKWMILGTIIKKHGKSEKTNSAIDRITKGSGTSDDYFLANNCFLYGAIYFPEEKHEFFKTLIPDLPFITTLIDRKHIIFMVDNFRNTEKIIKYFNKL
jgi:hypothetical protein